MTNLQKKTTKRLTTTHEPLMNLTKNDSLTHEPYRVSVSESIVRKTASRKTLAKNCKLTGENAPGAVLTDHEVELMRVLHEEFERGDPRHLGHRKLAAMFGCSRTTASNICHYRKRVAHL